MGIYTRKSSCQEGRGRFLLLDGLANGKNPGRKGKGSFSSFPARRFSMLFAVSYLSKSITQIVGIEVRTTCFSFRTESEKSTFEARVIEFG